MIKRILATALALSLALTMLFGCAEGGREEPENPPALETAEQSPKTAENSEAATEPVTEIPEETSETQTEPAPETEPVTETEPAAEMESSETAAPETEAFSETVATSVTAETLQSETFAVSVKDMSGKMYAVNDVNVRLLPDASSERIGHLDRGDEVEITGQAENGWYRIKFRDGEYFVSNSYLSSEKPAETTAAETTVMTTSAATASSSAAASKSEEKEEKTEKTKWIAAWGTAMLTAAAEQTPTNPGLSGNTVRQQVRVSAGGEKLRLVISNEYGRSELKIENIRIAKIPNPKKPAITLDTEKVLTVDGKSSFSVPAGKRVTTDVIDFEFEALSDLAITMKLGSVPDMITCHTASRCSAWVIKGDHVSDNDYGSFQEMTAWYFIAEVDTLAEEDAGVLVCLGDSLTDGASVTTNGFSTYPQELARQFLADPELENISVINMGIGATALYIYGGDIAGSRRANRDVLKVPGIKYCVLLMGVNDIGAAQNDISSDIIKEYKSIIKRCHERDIKVFGCTITPFKGNSYYSDLHEKIRLAVNEFVLSDGSGFDGVIDLSSAVASKDDPAKMDKKYVSVWNDYLHFNDNGYKYVGKTVYGKLKEYLAD